MLVSDGASDNDACISGVNGFEFGVKSVAFKSALGEISFRAFKVFDNVGGVLFNVTSPLPSEKSVIAVAENVKLTSYGVLKKRFCDVNINQSLKCAAFVRGIV